MAEEPDHDAYHREHAYTLPDDGSIIISPATRTSYRIGAAIAQGGFSHVFACTDDWNHDLVAKVLKSAREWQATQEKAIAEVVAQSIVRSPHIVQVFDTFVFRGAHYVISERCSYTLREIIQGKRLKPTFWFPSLAKALLHSLHFMHTQGLGHCDVHAGNVFLHFIPDPLAPEESAHVFKLGDFGLARPIDAMHPEGTFQNWIIPPEALRPDEFGPLDHRADLYQAGLVLLGFLLGSECKFDADEIQSGRPREVAEALQHPAGEVVAKLLRRHVEARPFCALDAWRELQPLILAH